MKPHARLIKTLNPVHQFVPRFQPTTMSQLHLGPGSQPPPNVPGLLRLYSMEYCPYAKRSRLVLKAKNIPHDIVNINLAQKPDWYFKFHPEGKVPSLDTGKEVIIESLDICDYLDDKYPEPPLYPLDPVEKKRDKEVIQKIGDLTSLFVRIIYGKEEKSAQEWADEFKPTLEYFETELRKRGTSVLRGGVPGMVDYMVWPWVERIEVLSIKLDYKGQALYPPNSFPLLQKWRKAMRESPVVKELSSGAKQFQYILQQRWNNLPVDYDYIDRMDSNL